MVSGKFPAGTILLHSQLVAGHEMPPEHLAAPAAFEANDKIALYGSPDRNGRGPLSLGFGYRFSASRERLMDGRDQGREFIGCDLVSPNICSNDIGSDFSIE